MIETLGKNTTKNNVLIISNLLIKFRNINVIEIKLYSETVSRTLQVEEVK